MKKIFLFASLIICLNAAFGQKDYLDIGNRYLDKKKYAEAEKTFRMAIDSDATNQLVYKSQLSLALLKQEKYKEAQTLIDQVLKKDSTLVDVLWYGGLNNYTDLSADPRKSVMYFKKALRYLKTGDTRIYTAHRFIGRAYRILLKTDGLTYEEVNTMLSSLKKYTELQPNAQDTPEITAYVKNIEEARPKKDDGKKWTNK